MNNRNVVCKLAGFAVTLAVLAAPSGAIGDPAKPSSGPKTTTTPGTLNATQGATGSAVRDARETASRRAEAQRKKQRIQPQPGIGEQR